jgi:hypothetical protein
VSLVGAVVSTDRRRRSGGGGIRAFLTAGIVSAVLVACATPTAPTASATVAPSQLPATPGPTGSVSPSPSIAPAPRDLVVRALPKLDGALRGTAVSAVAGGTTGYVLLGNDRRSGGLLSWTSVDGGAWTRHWLPGTTFGGGTPDLVIASPSGYLALGWTPEPGSPARRLWSSPDGAAWQAIAPGALPAGEVIAMAGAPWGAAAVVDRGAAGTVVTASTDGRTWQVADLPGKPLSSAASLVPVPDGVLVVGWSLPPTPSGESDPLAWQSSDGHSWRPDPGLAVAIGRRENSIGLWQTSPWGAIGTGLGPNDLGRVVGDDYAAISAPPTSFGRLVGGSAGLVWVEGMNPSADCAAIWQYDGSEWRSIAGPPSDRACLDGTPLLVASASVGRTMLVLGAPNDGSSLVAWLVGPDDQPRGDTIVVDSATPPAAAIPDPLSGAISRPLNCPPVPTTLAGVEEIGARAATACFGHAPIGFRAWVVDPGEGYGGTCAEFSPAWIRECVLPDYLLASTPNNEIPQDAFHAMRSPSATGATKGVGRWVTVVGHFDDPVSPSCRGYGDTNILGIAAELPPAVAVVMCRLVFVVTDIRTTT